MAVSTGFSVFQVNWPSVKIKFKEFHPTESNNRTQTSDQESYIDMYQTFFNKKHFQKKAIEKYKNPDLYFFCKKHEICQKTTPPNSC